MRWVPGIAALGGVHGSERWPGDDDNGDWWWWRNRGRWWREDSG